ncbi:MAG: diguanylate cyclase [Chloroflexota bacterium]
MSEAPGTAHASVCSVLIADDDEDFRSLLVRRAKRMGLAVVEARDGLQALEAIRRQAFDAVVVDVYMPGCTGVEVAQAAKQIDANVQAIVLTGSATLETAVDALRAGVYDYLTKPLESLDAFEHSLTRALEHQRLLRENQRLFAEVQRLAVTDPLTGLFNRRKLDEALEVEMERSRRYGRSLSMVMLDVDKLKAINDTHGHPVGDAVLQAIAQAMRHSVRRVDYPTRLGGDEFLVLLPEADLREAARVAGRIFNQVASLQMDGVQVSMSAGVAQWRPAYALPEDFLRAVDQALYQAKHAGGHQIAVITQDLEGEPDIVRAWDPENVRSG